MYKQAEEHVQQWREMSLLPSAGACEFFVAHAQELEQLLVSSLRDPDLDVRMGAAEVVSHFGADGKHLVPEVLEALEIEPEPLGRVYFLRTLQAVGQGSSGALNSVRRRFREASDEMERIHAAAALYGLSSDLEERAECESFVCSYLVPRARQRDASQTRVYWRLRRTATDAVTGMAGASKAVPILKAMLVEHGAKFWLPARARQALSTLDCAEQDDAEARQSQVP